MAFENITVNKKIYIPLECEEDEFPDIFINGKDKVQVRILHHESLHFKAKPVRKAKFFCCQEDHVYEDGNEK